MARLTLFPVRIQITVDNIDGSIVIRGATVKFDSYIDDYPDLKAYRHRAVKEVELSSEDKTTILKFCQDRVLPLLGGK